jgi:hypothetical protein
MIRLDVDKKALFMVALINTYKSKYGYIYDSYRLREPRYSGIFLMKLELQ